MHLTRIFFAAVFFLTSCQSPYSITLNERVLYRPDGSPALAEIVKDPGLQACINQRLSNDSVSLTSITLLACPNAGISTLEGLQKLENLEQLDLSENRISNLSPLVSLLKLRLLNLPNNEINDIGPLQSLPVLRFVSLQGNPRIPCRQLEELEKKIGSLLNKPSSCQR